MMYKKLVSIIFLLGIYTAAYCQYYPNYENILKYFLSKKTLENYPKDKVAIVFEKKPEGWVARARAISPEMQVLETISIWSSKQIVFLMEQFEKDKQKNIFKKENYTTKTEEFLYNTLPYYGYDGWEQDIINTFQKRKNNSDTILFSLAYAYSRYASKLLYTKLSETSDSMVFNISEDDTLSIGQLYMYRKYRYGAISYYKKLIDSKTHFSSALGSNFILYSNEHLTSFLDLLLYSSYAEAEKELKDQLYTPFILEYAKNTLTTCNSKSILFAKNNTDFYPLMYLQYKVGYRRDVAVVSENHILNARYRYLLEHPFYLTFPKVKYTIPERSYQDDITNILFVEAASKEAESLSNVLQELVKGNRTRALGEEVSYVPTANLTLKIMPNKPEEILFVLNRDLLEKSELVLLDILTTNYLKHEVYFTASHTVYDQLGFAPYLQLEGTAFHFLPTTDTSAFQHQTNNSTVLAKNLFSRYSWKYNLPETPEDYNTQQYYKEAYIRLAEALHTEKKDAEAGEILEKYTEMFPFLPKKIDTEIYRVASLMYIIGNSSAGDALLKKGTVHAINNFSVQSAERALLKNNLRVVCNTYNRKYLLANLLELL